MADLTSPSQPPEGPAATPLAAHIPPLECDHREALALLNATSAREITDEQFEAQVRLYRLLRQKDAAKRLERDRKRAETASKKADIAQRKSEREAKRAVKAQGGGEGGT